MVVADQKDLKDGDFLLLGKVSKPFGLRGEVRIRPYNPQSETFELVDTLYLRSPQGELKEFQINRVRRHQDCFLVKFQGIDNREQAEQLRGYEVLVKKDQLATLQEGEYYWYQLLGLKVKTESGELLGEVIRIEETNPYLDGNDVLIIKTECQEVMIPFIEEVVKEVNLEKGEIIISGLEDYKL